MASENDNGLNSAIDQLKSMLSSKDGANNLANLIGTLKNSLGSTASEDNDDENNQEDNQSTSLLPEGLDIGKIMQLLSMYNNMQSSSENAPSVKLLNSLKPYMRKTRHESIDMATKMLSLSQMGDIFTILKDLF